MLLGLSRGGARFVQAADYAQDSFFQRAVFVPVIEHPAHSCIEIRQRPGQARVAIGVKTEGGDAGILGGAAPIGAPLLTYRPVQESVAQKAAQYAKRRGIRMLHRHGGVGACAKVHLGIGQPQLGAAFAAGRQAEALGVRGLLFIGPGLRGDGRHFRNPVILGYEQ